MGLGSFLGGIVSAVSPIAPLLGGLASGAASFLGGREQRTAAIDQSAQQMAFQERMSNTSYQRGMEDMRAAGLNPLLAYQRGGASSPAGSMAPIENVLGQATHTAMAGARLSPEVENLRQLTKTGQAQEELNREAASTQRTTQSVNTSQAALNEASEASQRANAAALESSTRLNNQRLSTEVFNTQRAAADAVGAAHTAAAAAHLADMNREELTRRGLINENLRRYRQENPSNVSAFGASVNPGQMEGAVRRVWEGVGSLASPPSPAPRGEPRMAPVPGRYPSQY